MKAISTILVLFFMMTTGLPALGYDWNQARAVEIATGKPKGLVDQVPSSKIYLIDIWASWCEPCRESFPFLDKLHAKFAQKGLVVMGVSFDNKIDLAQEFLKLNKVSYPQFFDEGQTLRKSLKLVALPYMFILNSKGEQVYSHRGFKSSSEKEVTKKIEDLLKSN